MNSSHSVSPGRRSAVPYFFLGLRRLAPSLSRLAPSLRRLASGLSLLALSFGLVLLPCAGSADPFAPAGTERVRVRVPNRAAFQEIMSLGLHPEEPEGGDVLFRVTPAQWRKLEGLGLDVRLWTPQDGATSAAFLSYAAMVADLEQIAADFPLLARLSIYGESVQGRSLYALKLTRNPEAEEAEPEVRFCGAHHGNEQMSVSVCMRLAHHLVDSYASDPEIARLLDEREVWIVPMVNPDGVEANSRYNAHGVDLNRNYGYMWEYGSAAPFSEPEVGAMRDLATENWFTLSLSFHTSGDVVNSVWNYSPDYTADDAVVWKLTNDYAEFNGYWAVRGWYWYETHGDCNDWSYGARADIDWTIETDNFNEENVWNENRPGMIHVIDAAGWGIHGVVTDAVTGEPLRAAVRVDGNGWPAFTDPLKGDFHKPLLSGTYTLRVTSNGHEDLVIPGVVVPFEGGVVVDAALGPGGGYYADRIEIADVADPNNAYNNPTSTMSMLGAPDGIGCSLGRGGDAVVDLGPSATAVDGPGDDLWVHESSEDAIADGFSLYGADAYLGPWTLIGVGTGTTSFDLAAAGMTSARYLHLVDDGNGDANGAFAGFDVDAVETFGTSASAPEVVSAGGFRLLPPAPNPVRSGGRAELAFDLPARTGARLDVFDPSGRRLGGLAVPPGPSGRRGVSWDGRGRGGDPLAPGVYLLRLAGDMGHSVQKLVIVP